jgi:hypothetical protein
MTAYQIAREAGLRLDRVLPDAFQLRDGGTVMAILHRSERGVSAWVNPAYDAGVACIARDENGWQHVGRSAYLSGMVKRVMLATPRGA